MQRAMFSALLLAFGLQAQIAVRPSVQATGNATVMAPPDQATMDATVTTQGTTAQDAASKNATQTNNLTAALTKLLGAKGTVQNTNYWIYPVYQVQGVQPAAVVGYSASSTIEVTLFDLSLAGAVIDTAAANGTTGFNGIYFSIKDPDPQKQQALRLATQQAMAHANAMAGGAGHTVGSVRTVTEGAYVAVTPIYAAGGVAGTGGGVAAPTTIQPGTIQVQATVTVVADLD